MSNSPVKTRFAPSPTGHLHLGNLRTALFSYLLARREGGVFLLRIEDTDAERSLESHVASLMGDLRWLGLEWQEGPEIGGAHGPYFQSARGEIYATHYERLESAGLAYPCFCSDKVLKLSRKAQLAAGQPPRYPGTCARLSADEVRARFDKGLQPTLRFRVPPGRRVGFEDLVRGPQTYDTDTIGDFVIRRSDGTPSFFFSNAVDDAMMAVTHVLRGEDHLANTPRQMMIMEVLDLPVPAYGHISLIMGDDGAPLSKRHGAVGLEALRERGYLPRALLNHLARLGHSYEDDGLMDPDALARGFDTARLGRAPARHDPVQLDHWQHQAVLSLSDAELERWLGSVLDSAVPEPMRAAFLKVVRDNISFPGDARDWADRLFGAPPEADAAAREAIEAAGSDFFEHAIGALSPPPEDFRELARRVGEATGRKGRDLFMPLRAALTGLAHGPEMRDLWPLLGPERAAERFAAAREA
ncbi:glutamate--tRNA ligase [Thioalkalivibrio denitrificans]|uniref:Glutamate--tRNA ligase n=1 Tax=Thioalkalivibrio denitrificans TaxID=108003 RepID=A0A1V3NKA1_9GAMM|nr:glutamate--tRNA ligase [Thioalkalivibrio denitrificans]OOG25363.1 glutamate--tRNA ligase [Thioalkalivibrio denitrificans]